MRPESDLLLASMAAKAKEENSYNYSLCYILGNTNLFKKPTNSGITLRAVYGVELEPCSSSGPVGD